MAYKGISFLNPVLVEGAYMKKCAEYAIKRDQKHFELIGPTHDPVRGNCDGIWSLDLQPSVLR